jgi:hypothetical protein
MSNRKTQIIELIDKLSVKATEKFDSDEKMNGGDIVEIIVYIMLLVEKSPLTLSSKDKLYVAKKVIYRTIKLLPNLNKKDREDLASLVPSAIEAIISTSNDKLNFGKKNKLNKEDKVDMDELVNKMYNRIVNFIRNKRFTADTISLNLFIILTQLMIMVEEYPMLTGPEKKLLALDVMKKLEEHIFDLYPDMTIEQKQALTLALMMLPTLIDKLVETAKGQIDFSHGKKMLVKIYNYIKNKFCTN